MEKLDEKELYCRECDIVFEPEDWEGPSCPCCGKENYEG